MKKIRNKTKSLQSNFLVVTVLFVFLFVFLILMAFSLLYSGGHAPINQNLNLNSDTTQIYICTTGQIKSCSVENCSGISTCINGVWGSCTWQQVCTPGTQLPCLQYGCSYAIQKCNECGTGYNACSSQ